MMEHLVQRAMPVQDMEIRRSGDGRTVVAYATPFDVETEVRDQHGHYIEVVRRSAFDKTIRENFRSIQVFYNHGLDIHGGPSEKWSSPLGVPLEVKPDGKGLLTVTRYDQTPHAEEVLEMIRSGSIRAQSYTARMFPGKTIKRGQTRDGLPILEHSELGLREYGPTPLPMVHHGTEIVAVRSATQLVDELNALPDEERAEVLATITGTPPEGEPPPEETHAETEPPDEGTPEGVPSNLAATRYRLRAARAKRRQGRTP